MAYPCAGEHYPRSVGEFQAWFPTDADGLDYLEWLQWPNGFVSVRAAATQAVDAWAMAASIAAGATQMARPPYGAWRARGAAIHIQMEKNHYE